MKKNGGRKNYFIDKAFQTKFILKFCLIVVVSSLAIGGLIFVLSQDSTTVAIENTRVVVKQTSDFIFPIVAQILAIVAACSALVVVALTMIISHRIAGPLYRMKKEVDAVNGGDLTGNFNLRDKDQLKALAKSLSEMNSLLRQNNQETRTKLDGLKKYLSEKDYCLSKDDRGVVENLISEIEKPINFFKIQ